MDATTVVLSVCCLVLAVVVAVLASAVPALWWVHLRRAQEHDAMVRKVAELDRDIKELDDVVERLCKAASLDRG